MILHAPFGMRDVLLAMSEISTSEKCRWQFVAATSVFQFVSECFPLPDRRRRNRMTYDNRMRLGWTSVGVEDLKRKSGIFTRIPAGIPKTRETPRNSGRAIMHNTTLKLWQQTLSSEANSNSLVEPTMTVAPTCVRIQTLPHFLSASQCGATGWIEAPRQKLVFTRLQKH